MSVTWTAEAVLALAPDSASAKSGQGLAAASQWGSLGRQEHAIWGEIKGSGSTPYQTRIDLREPAFKCSCPSRKFPCKHGIGLLLAYSREPAAFAATRAPAWVADWLAGREQRAERKVERAAAPPQADPEAQRKRAEQREGRVATGLEQLHTWLLDLVRAGFAQAQAHPAPYWDAMTARLVDAQAPGLARLVASLQDTVHSGPGWEQRLLHAIGSVALIRSAYLRRDSLPAALVDEVRGAIGWTTREEDVLGGTPGLRDRWHVMGSRASVEDRLRVRRTWIRGATSRRFGLVLDFAVGSQPLAPGLPPGCEADAEVAFYPGTLGLRAAFKTPPTAHASAGLLPGTPIEGALEAYADALARAPWLERWPMALAGVRMHRSGEAHAPHWHAVDESGRSLDLAARFAHGWSLFALAGDSPIEIFGEWDGATLLPLAATRGGQFYTLGDAVVATREIR